MKHYSKTSYLPTQAQNIIPKMVILKLKKDNNSLPTTLLSWGGQTTLSDLKNSKASGPNPISNIHLKPLGPHALNVKSEIFN